MKLNIEKLFRTAYGCSIVMQRYDASVERCPFPLESRYVKTRFGETHFLLGGPTDSETILVLHWWNGNASSVWEELPFLLPNYRTIMVDIPGHSGKSAPIRLRDDSVDYVHWLNDLLDGLGVGKVHLLGVSGGGWMSLKFTSYANDRLIDTVAIGAAGLSPFRLAQLLMNQAILAPIVPIPGTVRMFIELMTHPNGRRSSYYERYLQEMVQIFRHLWLQSYPCMLTDEELSSIETPVLLLMGERECFFDPLASVQRARSLIPGLVAAEIVKDAGHAVSLDQPAYLESRVLKFHREGR